VTRPSSGAVAFGRRRRSETSITAVPTANSPKDGHGKEAGNSNIEVRLTFH
jgi:hypothetical protein